MVRATRLGAKRANDKGGWKRAPKCQVRGKEPRQSVRHLKHCIFGKEQATKMCVVAKAKVNLEEPATIFFFA